MDKEDEVYTYTCTYKHTHTHTNKWKMDYYTAIKRDEILPFAITWIDMEDNVLSEVRHLEKDKYYY